MLIIFQILFIIFAGFAITNVMSRKRSGNLGPKAVVFWVIFWAAAVLVVLWPDSSTVVAGYLGIGRGTDLVVYLSLALIFFLIFKLNVKLDALNRDLTKVVRHNAINSNNQREEE